MNSKNNKTSDSNRLMLVQRLITDKLILTLIRLAFFAGSFSGGSIWPHRFIFQEELIQYQYNFLKLLNNLFKVGCM